MQEQLMSWNTERVDALKKLWAEGNSASQIAAKIGGVTRNAVIGKVHRLGLSGRSTPSRPVKVPNRKFLGQRQVTLLSDNSPASKATIAQLPVMVVQYPKVHGNSLGAVLAVNDSQCKWPIGDPLTEGFSFCGCPQHTGPYCYKHFLDSMPPLRRAAYQITQARRNVA